MRCALRLTSSGNRLLDISKTNDMYFVYAFFFENGDDIHVKVGISSKPFQRLKSIVQGSPFPVAQAVYTHAGSKSIAHSFEMFVKNAIPAKRTRGEWYMFSRKDGVAFRDIMATCYAKSTGRPLKWSKIDLDDFHQSCKDDARAWRKLQETSS